MRIIAGDPHAGIYFDSSRSPTVRVMTIPFARNSGGRQARVLATSFGCPLLLQRYEAAKQQQVADSSVGDKPAAAWVVRQANTQARIWAGGVAYGSADRRLLLLAEQQRAAVSGSLLLVVRASSDAESTPVAAPPDA